MTLAASASSGITLRQMVDDLAAELGERSNDVRVDETPTSWVLHGDRSYRVWKPIRRLGFDGRAAWSRHEATCLAVADGERQSPRSLYAATPIAIDRGRATFRLVGPAVEWAVVSARFDERARLDVLARSGALSAVDIERLADWLAAVHADTPAADARSAWATSLVQDVHAQLAVLGASIEATFGREKRCAFEAEMRALVETTWPLLLRRGSTGAVRQRRGDIRLDRIYLRPDGDFEVATGDRLEAHDGPTDVAVDIASIVIDLARAGRPALAERFAVDCAAAEGDTGAYAVLPFYERYQALHRARRQAAAGSWSDGVARVEVRDAALAEARALLAQATAAPRTRARALVVVSGSDTSGRARMAHALDRRFGLPVVTSRTDRDARDDASGLHLVREHETASTYARAIGQADAVLVSGRSVVMEGRFRDAGLLEAARVLATAHGVDFRIVECTRRPSGCRGRLESSERALVTHHLAVDMASGAAIDAVAAWLDPSLRPA